MGSLDAQRHVTTGYISWGSVISGAMSAAALSSVLIGFGIAVGLSVASSSPTWRNSSAALALLSGLFLILQALAAFGLGGYLAGRTRPVVAADAETVERTDGAHGLLVWALAILIGVVLTGILANLNSNSRSRSLSDSASAAEPLLSYELDRLFRSPRRSPNVDLTAERAEAGRNLADRWGTYGIGVRRSDVLDPASSRCVRAGTAGCRTSCRRRDRQGAGCGPKVATDRGHPGVLRGSRLIVGISNGVGRCCGRWTPSRWRAAA